MNNEDLYMRLESLPPFDEEEIHKYFKKMNDGDTTAREKIIKGSVSLVRYIVATKFSHNIYYDQDDLVSIGILGLIKSIDTFDMDKRLPFSYYLETYVILEIMVTLGIMTNSDCYEHEYSFEEKIILGKFGKEFKVKDILEDNCSEIYDLEYVIEEDCQIIRQVVDKLPKVDRDLIKMYFGFKNEQSLSAQEIADTFNIPYSDVVSAIKIILNKIRLQLLENGISEKSIQKSKNTRLVSKSHI